MIHFDYNEKKATQAAVVLLKNAGGRIDYYLLTKMLYIAERESLKRWNRVMFGGKLASMEFGPAHSSILDSSKYKDMTTKYWMENIEKPSSDNVVIFKDTNIDDEELSQREINLLNDLYIKYRDFDFHDMKKLTHEFPEYENTKSSIPISVDDILQKAFNRNTEVIEKIEANANLMNYIHSIA
jgi:uncharacterized phage-associated protein